MVALNKLVSQREAKMSAMESDMLNLRHLADAALQSAMQRLPSTAPPAPLLEATMPSHPTSRAQTEGGVSEDGEASVNRDPSSLEHVDHAIFGLCDLISSISIGPRSEPSSSAMALQNDAPTESSVERNVMYDQYKAQELEREAEREAQRRRAALKTEQEAQDRQVPFIHCEQ